MRAFVAVVFACLIVGSYSRSMEKDLKLLEREIESLLTKRTRPTCDNSNVNQQVYTNDESKNCECKLTDRGYRLEGPDCPGPAKCDSEDKVGNVHFPQGCDTSDSCDDTDPGANCCNDCECVRLNDDQGNPTDAYDFVGDDCRAKNGKQKCDLDTVDVFKMPFGCDGNCNCECLLRDGVPTLVGQLDEGKGCKVKDGSATTRGDKSFGLTDELHLLERVLTLELLNARQPPPRPQCDANTLDTDLDSAKFADCKCKQDEDGDYKFLGEDCPEKPEKPDCIHYFLAPADSPLVEGSVVVPLGKPPHHDNDKRSGEDKQDKQDKLAEILGELNLVPDDGCFNLVEETIDDAVDLCFGPNGPVLVLYGTFGLHPLLCDDE